MSNETSTVGGFIDNLRRSIAGQQSLGEEDSLRTLALNERRGFRLPTIYSNNDFFLTRSAAWTGHLIPNKRWGFLDGKERENYFRFANNFFERNFPANKDNAGQLLITNHVHSAEEWAQGIMEKYRESAGDQINQLERYVTMSRSVIEQAEFFERETYLFTRMGKRGDSEGIRGFMESMLDVFIGMFGRAGNSEDAQPSPDEKEFWSSQSRSTTDSLSQSWLLPTPIHRRRLEWIVRHLDTPGLPTPDTRPADKAEWDAGEWRTVLSAYTKLVPLGKIKKHFYKCIQVDAPTGEDPVYAAFLPVSDIPAGMAGTVNWLHKSSSLDFPVDASLRFEVIDPDRAERALNRPIFDAEAQQAEDAEAGIRPDEITAIQEQSLRQAKTRTRMQREPMAYWQCVMAVYDSDKEVLRSKVARLMEFYSGNLQVTLECPPKDQRELFYQSMPGSEILVEDWMHRTQANYLAAAAPWLSTSVGDNKGLYQGYTLSEGRKSVPVFFDLQNVVDDEGRAPTEAVTGYPGSGKTVSRGLKVALEDGFKGTTQFIWDPKNDFLPLKQFARRLGLNPDKVKLIDVADPEDSVSLDAFGIAEVSENVDERASVATEVLKKLCQDKMKGDLEGFYDDVISTCVRVVMEREKTHGIHPTMNAVVDLLGEIGNQNFESIPPNHVLSAHEEAWAVRAKRMEMGLKDIRESSLGRLLFRDPKEYGSIAVEPGDMVIFIASKLQTTERGDDSPTQKNIVSDVISGLMTDYIRSLLFLDSLAGKAKSCIFDEWHVISRTSRAAALVDYARRMGRSQRFMVHQLSQYAGDFNRGSLSVVWCSSTDGDTTEAGRCCDLLGIEPDESTVDLLANRLDKGQFLFKDQDGRVALVQVDMMDDDLLDMLNTEATAKAARNADYEERRRLNAEGVSKQAEPATV